MEKTKKYSCNDCKHETPRHSIICNSCLHFRNFKAKDMEKTYQPFIIKLCDEVFQELTGDITPSERNKATLCDLLTERFLEGKLSEGDRGAFESEEEVVKFVKLCMVNDNLEILHEKGLIGTYNDGESYFLTESGKMYGKNIMGIP